MVITVFWFFRFFPFEKGSARSHAELRSERSHPDRRYITCQKRLRNIIGQFSKKKQYITPLPHLLPSLKWVAARSNLTAGSNIKVLKL